MRVAFVALAFALLWVGPARAADCSPYRVDWSFRAASPISAPVSVDSAGRVTVATHEGYLHGLGPDGAFRWSYTVSGGLPHGVSADDTGQVYASSGDGTIVSLSPEGEPRWVFHSPVVADSALVVGPHHAAHFVSGSALHAVSSKAGLLWGVPLGGEVTGAPLLGPDGATWLATDDGTLHAVTTPFLSRRWTVSSTAATLLAVGGSVALVRTEGRVVAIDREGAERWSVAQVTWASVDPATGANLVLLVRPGALDFRRLDDGRLQHSIPYATKLSAAPLLANGKAYLPGSDGSVEVMDPAGEARRCELASSALFSPVFSGARVIVASGSGVVAALALPDGRP
jgi:outer membrane protein assembly factor BamB